MSFLDPQHRPRKPHLELSGLPTRGHTPQDFDSFEELLDYVDDVQQRLDGLTARLADLERQDGELRNGLEHLTEQVRQARRLQHDLLPTCLPDCEGLRISKLYLPVHELSGDMYDVVRLNDHQIVLNISDATGHGMAAALLNILVKQSLRAREQADAEGQPIYPHDLLQRLNEELLTINLSECQFITAIQAIYDEVDGTLLWARGGMPYPILIREGQQPQHLISEGGLIGALPNQHYDLVSTRLSPGDLLLLYSDGLQALLLSTDEGSALPTILETSWGSTLRTETLATHLEQIEDLTEKMSPADWPLDDITILALQGI